MSSLMCPYLPELLRSILTRHTLQDLRAAGVLVNELGDVVDGRVDDDVHALVGIVVGGDLGGGEGLGHCGWFCGGAGLLRPLVGGDGG